MTKYLTGAAIAGTILGMSIIVASAHMGMGAGGQGPGDMQGLTGTVAAINGNSVTVTLNNAGTVKIGDSVFLLDRTIAEANRPIMGTVGTVGSNTFTVQQKDGSTVTVNTSASTTVKKDGNSATLADIVSGAMVSAKGAFDSATKTLTATSVQIITKTNNGLHQGWFGRQGPKTTPSPTPTP